MYLNVSRPQKSFFGVYIKESKPIYFTSPFLGSKPATILTEASVPLILSLAVGLKRSVTFLLVVTLSFTAIGFFAGGVESQLTFMKTKAESHPAALQILYCSVSE